MSNGPLGSVGPEGDELITFLCERVYHDANMLWRATKVEGHGEGYPGVAGPSSLDDGWTIDRGKLDGAIKTLQIIRERKFS